MAFNRQNGPAWFSDGESTWITFGFSANVVAAVVLARMTPTLLLLTTLVLMAASLVSRMSNSPR